MCYANLVEWMMQYICDSFENKADMITRNPLAGYLMDDIRDCIEDGMYKSWMMMK